MVVAHKNKIICIDEVQKIPALLDEAHRLIEERQIRFLLTGSSARKLRAQGVNLLAGRAWLARMFPLNTEELSDWSLMRLLKFGSLPPVWNSTDPKEELDNYVQTYIEAELKAEGIIRKIPSFVRFLKTAALSSGELLNYQNIASDSGVPVTTVKDHYSILEDTMIGYNLEPWTESKKRKAIGTGKFYFFDIGVLNHITESFPENENSPILGNRFETFIINEIRCANFYQRRKSKISYWRSTSDFEVDLIFDKVAVEIKFARKATTTMLKGLKALKEENLLDQYILVSRDPVERVTDGIHHMFYEKFLKRVWAGEI
jgi:predicted AAA+ superfamily ATPase